MDFLLDPDHCYPALLARDARFDGQWFVAVKTTGIYCRPICRVRTPRRENCQFFPSATLAEAAHFRPCLKCRPELAPAARRWSAMDASEVLAREAARWLDEAAPEDAGQPTLAALAAHLGVSERHVRRVFGAVHGVSPLQYLQTRRLLLAKQLLTDTRWPMAELAHAAGFGSLRRFNAAFLEHYRLSPSALRRGAEAPAADSATNPTHRTTNPTSSAAPHPAQTTELRLDLRPPFQARALLQFLAARAVPGVEQVDLEGLRLARSVRLPRPATPGQPSQSDPASPDLLGWLQVQLDEDQPRLRLRLSASLWPAIATLMPRLRRWLDLDADPQAIAAALAGLPEGLAAEPAHDAERASAPLGAEAPGLRLPGALDRFELAIRAVLGQQVTVAAARTLATRLIARLGEPLGAELEAPAGITHAFPTPARMARATVDEIAGLGMPARRAQALIHLAQQWPGLAFAQGRGTVEQALAELAALPGLGPWTAQYMLMRGWSWPDAFPPGDVVLRQCLEQRAGRPLKPSEVARAAQAWAPYRSYAVLHLWRQAATASAAAKTKTKTKPPRPTRAGDTP